MMMRCLLFAIFIKVFCNISASAELTFRESENNQCGNIFTEKQFTLTSDNYPFPYPPDKECFYLLKGLNCTNQFIIKFLDFDIKTSVGCTNDRLEIGHQDALCGTTNGSKVYKAEEGSLKLKFISDKEFEKDNRGFRMLVTRIDGCDLDNSNEDTFDIWNNSEVTTMISEVEWTSKRYQPTHKPTYIPPAPNQCCQNNIFGSKNFLLVSPNFPYSSNNPTDCIYVIKKANPQVCRLRLNILFFSLGPPTETSCPYGYLEIDGKYICGCNSNLQLTTDFRDFERKILHYYSSGYNGNGYYGFVLEVTQDECSKRYSPEDRVLAERSLRNFRFYNDQNNRVSWPKNSNIDQSKLVNERIQRFSRQNIYKHFYFFAPEEEKDISWTQSGQEREETNYIETSTINTLITNLYNYQQCVQWNRNQMILLNTKFGSNIYQMCKYSKQNNIELTNCLVLNGITGNVRSAGYPFAYPANRNICYRFQILPGYCAVNLLFNDFQIEKSYDCLKDYLAINQQRYCGNYLQNKQVTIHTERKSHQDINFITDAYSCGKGFLATYQQVPCQNRDSPIIPDSCNPELPSDNCNRIISDKYFSITKEEKTNFCSFIIRKFSEDVCKIDLSFERFNLDCEVESITIDGKVYCGQMSGQTLTIIILEETTILYKRNSLNLATDYLGYFLIQGTQVSEDCEANTPEPVRLVLEKSKSNEVSTSNRHKEIYSYYYPDICELIKNNVTIKELPSKICAMLTKNHNVSDCNFSSARFVDLNDKKNITQVLLSDGESENLNYKVIDCPTS